MTPLSVAAGFAVGLLGVIVVFFLVVIYNDVVALERRIDKAWANIEVILQQRHDQLPALAWSPDAPIPAQAANAVETTRAVRSLFATVERYPEIRSAANVMSLQEEIERLEGMLADRRELYNDQVYRLNARIAQVPAVLLAGLFGWKPRSFFDADPDAATPARRRPARRDGMVQGRPAHRPDRRPADRRRT